MTNQNIVDAINFAKRRETVSLMVLQIKFNCGINQASMLMDVLEEKKIVAPFSGMKERLVITNLVHAANVEKEFNVCSCPNPKTNPEIKIDVCMICNKEVKP